MFGYFVHATQRISYPAHPAALNSLDLLISTLFASTLFVFFIFPLLYEMAFVCVRNMKKGAFANVFRTVSHVFYILSLDLDTPNDLTTSHNQENEQANTKLKLKINNKKTTTQATSGEIVKHSSRLSFFSLPLT